VGATAAHNAIRAQVTGTAALPPLTWSPTLAAFAQQWADQMASTSCLSPHHRDIGTLQEKGYGENLAASQYMGHGQPTTIQWAVNAWAAEKACWTYGRFMDTDDCNTQCYTQLHSDGCGHYTQVVWRDSTEVGCGVASCESGGWHVDIWICNYSPAGNYVGDYPY
jgi:pathogenesis-related protein 1